MKEKVLLTGGAGFIGSYIAKKLIDQDKTVFVYDSFIRYFNPISYPHYQQYIQYRFKGYEKRIIFIRGDTRDKYYLRSIISRYKPSFIIHLAALPIADIGDKNPEEAISSIIQGTVNILDIIKDLKFIKRFVYTSSSMVYGDFEYTPADEDHPKRPKGIYGGAKLAGEIITESYGRRYSIPYTIIRPSAVYGPGDTNRRVTQIFLENALSGKPIELYNGGESKLDFSFVEDVAEGFILATFNRKGENQIFNITRGEGRKIKELAEIIKKLVNRPLKIKITPPELYRPERGALSIKKAKKLLNYKPKYSLEEGMRVYYNFLKKFYE